MSLAKNPPRPSQPTNQPLPDAVEEAQTPRSGPETRPEQKTEHDLAVAQAAKQAPPASTALAAQPEQGKMPGFDFVRDPLNAKKPMTTFEEAMRADIAAKEGVMAEQRRLLESRYDLTPRFEATTRMSRGEPVPVGPTARLKDGQSWDRPGR